MSTELDVRQLLDRELDLERVPDYDWADRGITVGRRRRTRRRVVMASVGVVTTLAAIAAPLARADRDAVQLADGPTVGSWKPRGPLASEEMLDAAVAEYEKHGGPVADGAALIFAGEVRPGDVRVVFSIPAGH